MDTQAAMRLAQQHHTAGRLREAEPIYRQVLAAEPNHAEALNLLGLVALQCGQPAPAIALMEKSIALAPGVFYYYNNLAEAYKAAGRFADAARAFAQSLQLRPGDALTMHSLAVALERAGEIERAIELLRQTMRQFPQFAKAFMSLGAIFEHQARYGEALELFEQATALEPNYARARAARAGIWLRQGDYARGWDEYEWRWKVPKFPGRPPAARVPIWDGAELHGQRILLYAEQGLGDTIQFIRYAPLMAQRGGRVIVECPKSLVRLVRGVEGASEVVTPEDPAPGYDLQLPLLSLPRIFATRLETIPHRVPYVSVLPEVAEKWQAKTIDEERLKIGLCWAGGRSQPNRSIPSAQLEVLMRAAPGAVFYSLQKDRPPDDALPPASVMDWMSEVADFADTAGLIARMDLVISIDTSVAHLAGALGKPVWVMLAKHADWRWLLEREDSPWYPTMRLFRQETAGQWNRVVERVASQLKGQRKANITPT